MLPNASSAPAYLDLEMRGCVARLTLRRSPVNQINDAFLDQLDQALMQIEHEGHLSVVRIRSAQRAFSAGADLAMVKDRLADANGASAMMETSRRFHAVYDRLSALPAVTIAEIGGHALGGGCELALACDLRIASDQALIGLPETKVGLLPGAGGTQRLTALCGPGVAARLILTGELIDGREAARIGLVQWCCAAKELGQRTDELVERVAGLARSAIIQSKVCLREAQPMRSEGIIAEIEGIGSLMRTQETMSRVIAFMSRSGAENP